MPIRIFTTIDEPSSRTGFNHAVGINGAGQIVGDYTDITHGATHGFLYSGGAYTTLDDPLANQGTFATGINSADQIVGYYSD